MRPVMGRIICGQLLSILASSLMEEGIQLQSYPNEYFSNFLNEITQWCD